jgi:hypothetical protein
MKTAEELAKKFFLEYPSLYESHLLDNDCIAYWFRRVQADALRWAACQMLERKKLEEKWKHKAHASAMKYAAEVLNSKAKTIERGESEEKP